MSWRKWKGYDSVRDVYRPSILREPECECGRPLRPTAEVLLNVSPDGATMQAWACEAGHSEFRVV